MDLAELLRTQDGLVTTAQVVACGMSARTLRRRLATGGWSTVHPRVHLAAGHELGSAGRVRAASLWAGPSAVVSGPGAAYWHGLLDDAPTVIEVTLPRSLWRPGRPEVRVRRRDLDRADRSARAGVAVTARPLTVLETAAALPDGAAFLDRALQRRVPFPLVQAAYWRMLGAHGARRAGNLLRAAADRSASTMERHLVRLLRSAGLTGWVLNLEVGPYLIDVAFPDQRVAVELDGWAWHSDQERFRRDRRKGNELTLAGWTVLRITWHDLEYAPGRVLAELRHALERAHR